MTWFVIILSLVVLWVASLCKIFYDSTSTSKASIFNDGGTQKKKNVLLVIAHPDDESMFFSPTINYLTSKAYNLHILCLSTGNADGIGNTRRDELYRACAVLKVPLKQIKVLDHPDLQDGFGHVWSRDLLAKILEDEVTGHDVDMIITFDDYGVSGHRNHRDVHHGVLSFLQSTPGRNVEAWELVSINILRKYSGPIDIWLSILCAKTNLNKVIINEHPWKSFDAMAQHSSQWVWFRKLFVSFSSYTYVNTLKMISG